MLSNTVKTHLLKKFNLSNKINNNKIHIQPIISQEESESDTDSDIDIDADIDSAPEPAAPSKVDPPVDTENQTK